MDTTTKQTMEDKFIDCEKVEDGLKINTLGGFVFIPEIELDMIRQAIK